MHFSQTLHDVCFNLSLHLFNYHAVSKKTVFQMKYRKHSKLHISMDVYSIRFATSKLIIYIPKQNLKALCSINNELHENKIK